MNPDSVFPNLETRGKVWFPLSDIDACANPKAKIMTQHNHTHTKTTQTSLDNSHNNDTTNKIEKTEYSVYLAGDLWTHKDLIGNALLGDYIARVSKGRYRCVLPQDLEEPVHRTVDIRNVDLKHVLTCDMAIFNFDGAGLDSGTVVEFIYAKMLDIPCVILRTDFRAAGEGAQDQDPWNLMASHWPRSKVVKLHGMAEYQKAKNPGSMAKTIRRLYNKMSTEIVAGLDAVRTETPLIHDRKRLETVYDWAIDCPGAGYRALISPSEMQTLIADKVSKGLLS